MFGSLGNIYIYKYIISRKDKVITDIFHGLLHSYNSYVHQFPKQLKLNIVLKEHKNKQNGELFFARKKEKKSKEDKSPSKKESKEKKEKQENPTTPFRWHQKKTNLH